jgi:phosphate transport system permease protein
LLRPTDIAVKPTSDGGVARRTRSRRLDVGDKIWSAGIATLAGGILIVAGMIVVVLSQLARPTLAHMGFFTFLKGKTWDPVHSSFGALPFIYGTVVTSITSIVVAVPVGIGLAIFLSEMAPTKLRPVVSFSIELLAAIPSVVYGLWGVFVLVPWLRDVAEPVLARTLGFLPLFQGPPIGLGYLAGGLILAVMILPTISSLTLEVFKTVPLALREAAFALGATRWEVVRTAVLPYSRAGILGAVLLALGRALGETMAVTMVIGNTPEIRASLFSAGYSLPSVIANEFTEATDVLHVGALAGLALVLFGITLAMNSIARVLLHLARHGPAGTVA